MLKHVLIAMLMTAATTHPATAKMTVVASTTDIASIAQFVGGDLVEVSAIAKGTADPHFVEVLPSYMVKVKKARVYLRVGLDLDRWALPIIDGSRNSSLLVVDCSASIAPVNIPTGKVDASMGDIHPRGNPHYWLDPVNGVTMANTIATAFERADAANAAAYRANAERFAEEIKARQVAWNEKAKPLAGLEIITYHDAWPYFARAFGVVIAGFVEPLPGIEPTPSHTAELIELIK
ncbi:MAG TPA: metal ABC transporter substrate-binding protein, partial [Candidatus Krumholzibacteria bacterium]|nr:metal ABC transporter substrate-binding protein [Candidatus Krumholzibacteria bacterium]